MSEPRETYSVDVAGLARDLRLFEVAPGVRIAVLNILGDTELVEACAKALSEKLDPQAYDVLVTAEAKSIPIIYALAVRTGKPWIVLRKTQKLYMGDSVSAETVSITTGRKQTLYLDEKDRGLIEGKRVTDLAQQLDFELPQAGRDAVCRGKRMNRRLVGPEQFGLRVVSVQEMQQQFVDVIPRQQAIARELQRRTANLCAGQRAEIGALDPGQ